MFLFIIVYIHNMFVRREWHLAFDKQLLLTHNYYNMIISSITSKHSYFIFTVGIAVSRAMHALYR